MRYCPKMFSSIFVGAGTATAVGTVTGGLLIYAGLDPAFALPIALILAGAAGVPAARLADFCGCCLLAEFRSAEEANEAIAINDGDIKSYTV